jgi:hypothetical protein
MGGLMVATVLTLLVVPALYALWFRVRRDEPLEALPQPMYRFDRDTSPLRIAAE